MSVQIKKNVISKEEAQMIFGHVFGQKEHQRCWSINKHFWDDGIQNKSLGVVSVFVFEGQAQHMIADRFKEYLQPGEVFRAIQYYEWNQLSQINWHNDSHVKAAITIYLNDEWNQDWGGLFCWKEPDALHGQFIIPEFGTAVIARGNPSHHVSLVSPFAPIRKTIQIWIVDAPSTQSPPSEPQSEVQ